MMRSVKADGQLATWGSLVVGWLLCGFLLARPHSSLLNWDEVDYVRAAELGFLANALERGSLAVPEFAAVAVAKHKGGDPPFPEYYDESRDPLLLRHYHPPFVVYLLSVVAPSASERILRSVQVLGAFSLLAAALLVYSRLTSNPSWIGRMVVVTFCGWTVPVLFGSVSFHGWMAVWLVVASALLASCVAVGWDRWCWLFLGGVCGLALLTLETGVILVLVVLPCTVLFTGKAQVAEALRRSGLVLGALLLTVVLTWPGALLKASLPKIAAFHVYRVSLGLEYAPVGQRMLHTTAALAPGVVAAALAVTILVRRARPQARRWLPYAVIGGAYGIVMLPVALQSIYVVPALAPFAVLGGLAAHEATRPIKALISIAAMATAVNLFWARAPADAAGRADIEWLSNALRGRTAFVDGGHIYQYYLRGYDIRPVSLDYGGRDLYERVGGRYRPLSIEECRGAVVVLRRDRPGMEDNEVTRRLGDVCRRSEGVAVLLFDCG